MAKDVLGTMQGGETKMKDQQIFKPRIFSDMYISPRVASRVFLRNEEIYFLSAVKSLFFA